MPVALPTGRALDRVIELSHFSLDSYAETFDSKRGDAFSPVQGWTVLLSSEQFLGRTVEQRFDKSVDTFQATAYRNSLTGEVVVAYRGTDDPLELRQTSIPLGMGLDDSGNSFVTTAYLQDAY